MRIDYSSPAIRELGLSSSNVRCVLLLPLAYVAAASCRGDRRSLQALFESTAAHARLCPESARVARRWLCVVPSQGQWRCGLAFLRRLCDGREPLFTPADLLASVVWASSAAQLDREKSGSSYGPISPRARRALRDVEAWLGVDIGEHWADVLAELGDDLPRSRNLLPPCFKTLPESRREPAAPSSEARSTGRMSDYAGPASVPLPLLRRSGGRGLQL